MELHSLLWSHLHNSTSGMSRYGRSILTLSLRHTRGERALLGSVQFIGEHVDTTRQPGDKEICGGIAVLAVEAEVFAPHGCRQLLYRLEMQNEIEYKGLRRKLNRCYENFTALLGDLNKKENAAFILNDPGGREVLGLERFVEGRKQLSDILRRPVSFDPNEIKHVDTAAEALAASLNKFGRVEFPYMESLASRSRQELTDELGDRIFYNPMVKGYEIRERLAAGNVVAKAE